MHAVLLTVLALTGGNGTAFNISDSGVREAPRTFNVQQVQYAQPIPSSQEYPVDGAYEDGGYYGGSNHKAKAIAKPPHGGWWGMMPQTCYNPKFGCYGGERHYNRYPAFHGTYYRRPYNYRNVFDYPWHAELHEPVSHFAYTSDVQEGGPAGQVGAKPAPRTAQAAAPPQRTIAQPQGLRTLRR